ncbi:hypothetical protein [Brucella thiophenivorans]|uniref:Uncharacterized protein n=1 Tax=Brucella thiophenivorans TaxID=571255 RepID=A0A256FTN9_9HYPH|nr:hypothetical protein [Brucella thiophenivorans]OYR18227.1 hypothetical protein CEV31_4239 [Brucella thiophenivorans]
MKYDVIHNLNNNRFQLVALRDNDTHGVKTGDKGGYVDSIGVLSQDGDCWIAEDGYVGEKSRVTDNALVNGNAIVDSHSVISGNVVITDNAHITQSEISGNLTVSGNSFIDSSVMHSDEKIMLKNFTNISDLDHNDD